MTPSRTAIIDAVQAEYIAKTEQNLRAAEGFMSLLSLDEARHALNLAAMSIARLDATRRQRRGNPRAQLILEVRYYRTWQTALIVALEFVKDNSRGHLARYVRENAGELYREHPDRPEFAELLEKIRKWQST
jgi:hypothetical protein